jgi:hypothetical protein
MSARVTVDRPAPDVVRPSFQLALPPAPVAIIGLVAAMLFACAILLGSTQLGSGDYGQWLMASRPYAGLDMPAYRAEAAVPPVVPLLMGGVLRVVGDPVLAVHVMAVLLLVALGVAVYLTAASFFDSLAGLLAAVLALLVTDLFLQLFAFGGLLQAGSIVLLWLSMAALWQARRDPSHAQRWLVVGALCIGLGGLTHAGTTSIAAPAGVIVTGLVVLGLGGTRRGALLRMVPLGVILAGVAVYWILFLLPGATDLARNPASLDYRGPGRLVDALTGSWPTVAIIAVGGLSVVIGAGREVVMRRIGPWLAVLSWTAVTLGVLGAAVFTGASTDYPRFVTPIMAPLVVAAAGGASFLLRSGGSVISRATRVGSAKGWGVVAAGILLAAATPAAVGGFAQEARGYEVPDSIGLNDAASWVRDNVGGDEVVLTTAREGKWLEGISGRGALFSNSVRYSFRPEEWQRSLAADTLLRSTGGALANEFFFAKLTDAGAFDGSPRAVSIAANHGGEFVDLLGTVPSGTTIVAPGGKALATLANLELSLASLSQQADDAVSRTVWSGARLGTPIELHRTVSQHRASSTLEITLAVPDAVPSESLELTLNAGGQTPLDRAEVQGSEANLWYRPLGSGAPHLRVVASGTNAAVIQRPNGRLVAAAEGHSLRVLITDLTAADFPSMGLQALDPAQLADRYGVRAALLQRGPALAARERRLEGIGFRVARTSGAYELMIRDPGSGGTP